MQDALNSKRSIAVQQNSVSRDEQWAKSIKICWIAQERSENTVAQEANIKIKGIGSDFKGDIKREKAKVVTRNRQKGVKY